MGHHHTHSRRRGWLPEDGAFPFVADWQQHHHDHHDHPFGERGERGERPERSERGRGRRGGPPPWLAGMFGPPGAERGRGPRVRRGDVRAAILDVLATARTEEESLNGYQVIQQIAERSNDAWRPSPGSVYPTIQQLQDEGLVETDDERGRKTLRLTEAGVAYVTENPDELAAVWAPFEQAERDGAERVDLRPEIAQVMGAVWQIVTTGSADQRAAAADILVDTRRRLYGLLADGPGDDEATQH